VSLADFQTYLKDSSTDATLLAFYQSLLDAATELVYTWLGRDYTPGAVKTDVFWGDDSQWHATQFPVSGIVSWSYRDLDNTLTTPDSSDLVIRNDGQVLQARTLTFVANAEHRIKYQQPGTLTCPETVRQVITEIAAGLFAASHQGDASLGMISSTFKDGESLERDRFQDLTSRHRAMLQPYRRLAIG
jgi:hypothetical protein